ncbi:MAG: Mrp/NBP35 family ATP-binding protein [Terrimicrobiaceae bacterium]|nr:Mrp/NBP35 family ATP-binding protein [Terrimicrobiaceae bacterium]
MIREDSIRQALATVKYPGFSRDIVSFGLVKDVRVNGGEVEIQLIITTNETKTAAQIRDEAAQAVDRVAGVEKVNVKVDVQAPAGPAGDIGPAKITGVRHVIAVASGKGGVGKSTVASNLALALSETGAKVGLCDCDIYGPSIALMFGGNERPTADDDNRIIPIERYGLSLMSMGFLLDDSSPAVLRGPMVTRYTQQFLRQVAWGELDFLVLDLPPGTGDIQLTIVQTVALSGAVIVTTPQEVALIDARKAVSMFVKTNVPVLGIVENMSYFLCPGDGKRYDIFGSGGGVREAARLRVPLLGEIPIEPAVREAGDTGLPAVAAHPDSAAAAAFRKIAAGVRNAISA